MSYLKVASLYLIIRFRVFERTSFKNVIYNLYEEGKKIF